MAKERIMVTSRVKIEKFDQDMNLVEVHESKVPNYEVGNSGIIPSEQGNGKDKEKEEKVK